MIKLYSRLCLGHSCRTFEQAIKELEDVKKQYELTDLNKFESITRRNDKNIHLKFKWECSFYENSTLKEMEEDKEYEKLRCKECSHILKNSGSGKGCLKHRIS